MGTKEYGEFLSMLKIAVFCLIISQTLAVHPALGNVRRRSEGFARRQLLNNLRRRTGGQVEQDDGLAGDWVKDNIVFNIELDQHKDDASEWVLSTSAGNYIWMPFTKSKDGSLKFFGPLSTRIGVFDPELLEKEDKIFEILDHLKGISVSKGLDRSGNELHLLLDDGSTVIFQKA